MITHKLYNTLTKALAIDPKFKEALNNKGAALFITWVIIHKPIQYFDKALAIDPSDKTALNGKGVATAKLGNYTQAIYLL